MKNDTFDAGMFRDYSVSAWGRSMYGGYYVNYFDGGRLTGYNARTLREVREHVGRYGLTLPAGRRYDNGGPMF